MHKQGAASPCRCHSAYRRTVMDERSGLVKIPYAFRWSSAPEHRFKIAIIRNRLHEGVANSRISTCVRCRRLRL